MAEQAIQGLPPGATVTPIQGLPPGATVTPIAGLPPGAKVTPIVGAAPAAAPATSGSPAADATDPGVLSGVNTGFGRAVDRSMVMPEKAIRSIPIVGDFLGKHGLDAAISHDKGEAAKPNENMSQSVGGGLETLAEFLTGEEALKGLSTAAQLGKIAPVMKIMEKYPKLAKALIAGIRQGTVGGAQAAEHGETAGTSIATGATTGLIGGAADLAIPAVYSGVKGVLAKIRPGTTEIAGETIPELASQRPGAAPIAEEAATTTSKAARTIVKQQQEGGQKAITNIAQRATRDGLDRVNAIRQPLSKITDPSRLLEAPEGYKGFEFTIDGPPTEAATEGGGAAEPRKKQIGTQYVEGKGSSSSPTTEDYPEGTFKHGDDPALPAVSDRAPFAGKGHKEPVFQYLTGSKAGTGATDTAKGGGQFRFTDPAEAQAHLSQLEDIHDSAQFQEMPKQQQQYITAQRDNLQQQLGMYHAQETLNPHFEPVDSAGVAQHVNSFGDAADHIQASVKPIYQKLDEVSKGSFSALRNQMKAANKVMFQPGSIKSFEEALDAHSTAETQMQDLFNRHGGSVSRGELQSANAAWRDSVVLDKLHATIDGAFKGAPKNIADSLGQNRLLRGNSLEGRMNALLRKTPQADIERVIGRDGLENIYRVSNLLSKPETALATQNAFKEVASHLVRASLGGVAGGLMGHLLGSTATGTLIGAGAEDAARFVMRKAATDPRVGMLVDRAVRHQVNPKIFAPLIAAAINGDMPTQEPSK